jgi:molecular chaperone DnaK (HSP70)
MYCTVLFCFTKSKKAVLIEMGHTRSTVVVVDIGAFENSTGPAKLACESDDNLGALDFDLKLYEHFAGICKQKLGEAVTPGSKRGHRLLMGCERIRKLLSQLPESSITVENMSDNGDMNFTLKRDDLSKLCADLLDRFKALINKALAAAGVTVDNPAQPVSSQIAAVEVLGGGVRMQVVQAAIQSIVGEVS